MQSKVALHFASMTFYEVKCDVFSKRKNKAHTIAAGHGEYIKERSGFMSYLYFISQNIMHRGLHFIFSVCALQKQNQNGRSNILTL